MPHLLCNSQKNLSEHQARRWPDSILCPEARASLAGIPSFGSDLVVLEKQCGN
jgi:hypothetical protein